MKIFSFIIFSIILFAQTSHAVDYSAMVSCSDLNLNVNDKTYKIHGIPNFNVKIRKGPSVKYKKIINKTLATVTDKTQYISVYNTIIVREECSLNGWSKIRVISPDWLSDSHRGWVNSKFLVEENKPPKVDKFTRDDFIWGRFTKPHENIIVAGVNKIYREVPNCKNVDPHGVYISIDKGTKLEPVFFVVCGKGAKAFNSYFESIIQPVSKEIAIERCFNGINGISKVNGVDVSTVIHIHNRN